MRTHIYVRIYMFVRDFVRECTRMQVGGMQVRGYVCVCVCALVLAHALRVDPDSCSHRFGLCMASVALGHIPYAGTMYTFSSSLDACML